SHLVGELLGRFKMTRQPFPAVALASDAGTVTCITNDFSYEVLFERQVEALAQPGDIAFGFTTSGRSENVRRGLLKAKEKGAVTVGGLAAAGALPALGAQGNLKKRVLHVVGYSHIDAAWLWPWRDGSNLALTTFRSALDRLKETPDFRYTHSSSQHYTWVERA